MEKFIKYIGSIIVAVAILICLAGIFFAGSGHNFGYYLVRVLTLIAFAIAGYFIYKRYRNNGK